MKFITVRDLRGRSGRVWNTLAREREVILTSNGKPIAILSAVSEETLEESVAAVRRAKAVAAVEKLQRQSVQAGTDKLSPAEIATKFGRYGKPAIGEGGGGHEHPGLRAVISVWSAR